MALLEVSDIAVAYGDMQALFGVDIALDEGETIAVIGANGAGKSTLLRTIAGFNRPWRGTICFAGQDITGRAADRISRLGIAMVPEGRRLFPSLTVEENLLLGAATRREGRWTLERIHDLFPGLSALRRTPSMNLSGGQQQMVSIGRALLTNPRVLLCDEISLGLAPKIVNGIYERLDEIRADGISVVLVEQDVERARASSDRLYCLLEGRISMQGASASFSAADVSRAYFGA